MGLYLYLYHKPKLLFGLLTFFIYLLLIFTQTRGAILGGFISIVFFFIFLRKKFPLLKADLIRLAVPIVIATICINLHPKTSFIKRFTKEIIKIPASEEISTKKQEIQSISDDISLVKPKKEYQLVGGAAGRIEIWKTTLAIIKDYPLLGIGPENLEVLFPYYKTIEYVRSSSDYNRSNRAHNQILEFFMTRGILGGLIYLAILATLFYFGIRLIIKGEKLGIPILCTQIAYIVQNLFGFGTLSISSIFWLSAGILNNLYSTQYSDKNRIYPIHNWLLPSLFTMVILGISFLWLFQTIKDYAIDRTFQIAEIYRNSGYKKECLPLYKKVLAKQSYERRYYEPLIDRYLEESPEKAIKLLKKALSFIKDDYVYYFYLGLAYDKLKNTKKAEDSYKKAIKNCRYFGDAFHNLGDLYRRNNRFKEALIYLRKAYEIDPKRPEYIDSLAGLYLSLGNEKKALQLYKTLTEVAPSYPHILKVHKQLRGLYYKFGKIKETIRECEEILKLAPNDIETLWGLATLYYNTKRLKKAEVLCHKILKLHPNYQQAIRMLLFIKKNKA
jgi:tetratricopeptide (TPR) repeat protein